MKDESIIEVLTSICLLRSTTTAPEVIRVLDQAEAVINWLLVESAVYITTALRVAEYQAKELELLRLEEPSCKYGEVRLQVLRHTAGNA